VDKSAFSKAKRLDVTDDSEEELDAFKVEKKTRQRDRARSGKKGTPIDLSETGM
jgi:hypothetical protein